jgi:hypothetical protein
VWEQKGERTVDLGGELSDRGFRRLIPDSIPSYRHDRAKEQEKEREKSDWMI